MKQTHVHGEDPTLIITAARRYVFVDWPWLFTCDELRNSHSAALGAVRADPNALRCLSLWWGDREVVLTAVQQQGMLLECAKDLQADREVVLAAVRADGNALQMASWDLRKDPMVLSSAARKWWAFDWSILLPVRCDKVVVQAAVELDWRALEFASEDLKDDLDVLRAAVRQSCLAMRWASDAFKADKDKMHQVVNIKGTALQFASPHLKDDKDLVLAAVQQDGRSLQHASERLQLDPELRSASGWLRSLPFPWSKNHLCRAESAGWDQSVCFRMGGDEYDHWVIKLTWPSTIPVC